MLLGILATALTDDATSLAEVDDKARKLTEPSARAACMLPKPADSQRRPKRDADRRACARPVRRQSAGRTGWRRHPLRGAGNTTTSPVCRSRGFIAATVSNGGASCPR